MRHFTDKIVVLTGAAGGIGRALARRFANDGARLALIDRDVAGLKELRGELETSVAKDRLSLHVADLADPATPAVLAAELRHAYGGIDVLLNNAGLTVHGTFADHTPSEIDRVLDVDLRAVLQLTHACLPLLRDGARRAAAHDVRKPLATGPLAHIGIVASMAGVVAFPYQSVYSAAKFGLRGFAQALRCELSAERIGVTAVLPGTTATDFLTRAASHDSSASTRLAALMRRYGTAPARVAEAMHAALAADRGEVRVGWDCHLLTALAQLAPPLLPALLSAGFRQQLLGRRGDA